MTRFLFVGQNARTSKTITLGGVQMPPLKSLKVQYYDIQTGSYRDITPGALLHKETICWDKIKLVCTWGYLSQTEAKAILNSCSKTEYTTCTFFNPNDGDWATINVYRGDREVALFRDIYDDGDLVGVDYEQLTVNFVQQ